MEIWINPECSKCQSALSLLDAEGAHYTIRYYLEQPPTAQELVEVLARLGLQPWDITRLGEPIAEDLGLTSWPRDDAARPRWIDALATHPTLIQRPIITADDGTAAVARSPEAVRAIMGASSPSDRR
jgi:arsenate reductase